jgi:hypothetical protein
MKPEYVENHTQNTINSAPDGVDAATLASIVDDRYFETFLRTYVRNKLADAIRQAELSERQYSSHICFSMGLEKATWDIYLGKDYVDEKVRDAETLAGGLYEGLRRIDFRTSQKKFLTDQT